MRRHYYRCIRCIRRIAAAAAKLLAASALTSIATTTTATFFASSTAGAGLHAQQPNEVQSRRVGRQWERSATGVPVAAANMSTCTCTCACACAPPGGAVLIHLVDTVSRPDRKPHTRHVVNAQWSAVLAEASSLEIVSRLELGHQASAFCGDGRGYSEQAAHRGTMST